ncbi:hypothetical protein DH2020_045288 [Rehmannia glutinosa]|uniref:Uncharacterized protein n=1 Tax=Rehmannia glutinosa TaxID=99300 RepID=A0ABR0UFB3_REHGL
MEVEVQSSGRIHQGTTTRRKTSVDYVVEDVTTTLSSSPVYVQCQDGLKKADTIKKLPGQPHVEFDQYSGYVTISGFDPCSEGYVHAYLNTPKVQKALHANVTGTPGPWAGCSDIVHWQDSPDTVLPLIKELMATGIRVWIYR